jgi:hypothetical protein
MPSTRGLVGAAGEYYVAAELSRRDWLATVTIKNSPGADVLAQRLDRRRIVAIQTKTASPGSHFRLNVKDEALGERDNEWYVLVSLRGDEERPAFYVVPRHVMAAIVYLEHRDWLHHHDRLRAPVRTSQQRKANPMRTIRASWIEGYRENWALLDGSAWDAPFLADPVFLDLAAEVPLSRYLSQLERDTSEMMANFTEQEWQDARREMTQVLIGRARQGRPIAYSDLAQRVRSISFDYYDPLRNKMLGEICASEDKQGHGASDELACWVAEYEFVTRYWQQH